MKLTKEYILKRVNRLLITFKVNWEDLVDELDMGIEEINKYLSTKYPAVSEILDEFSSPNDTYSYRSGGEDRYFFPIKYFNSIVIPFAATQLLTIEEEFSEIYAKYANEWQENLFVMARDEISSIPQEFISAPQGVYFTNPDPAFKENPEQYFNREIHIEKPRLKIEYSWGTFFNNIPSGVKAFVDKPLPIDNNRYKPGDLIYPVSLSGQNFGTYLVDYEKTVLGIFLGWSLKDSGDANDMINPNEPLRFGHEDIILYAVFDFDLIGVKYNGNGGTLANWKPTYIGSDDLNTEVTPYGGVATRKGFKFVGFNPPKIDIDQSIINARISLDNPNWLEAAQDVTPETDIIFKAEWDREKYSITYQNLLEEDEKWIKNTSFYYGEEVILDQIPKKEFIGWWDNQFFTGDQILKIPAGTAEDITLYAKYNNDYCLVTLINEHLGIVRSKNYKYGSVLSLPTYDDEVLDPILANYTIDDIEYEADENLYWINKETKEVFSNNSKVYENLTLIPIYQKTDDESGLIKYTITAENDSDDLKLVFIKGFGAQIIDLNLTDFLYFFGLEIEDLDYFKLNGERVENTITIDLNSLTESVEKELTVVKRNVGTIEVGFYVKVTSNLSSPNLNTDYFNNYVLKSYEYHFENLIKNKVYSNDIFDEDGKISKRDIGKTIHLFTREEFFSTINGGLITYHDDASFLRNEFTIGIELENCSMSGPNLNPAPIEGFPITLQVPPVSFAFTIHLTLNDPPPGFKWFHVLDPYGPERNYKHSDSEYYEIDHFKNFMIIKHGTSIFDYELIHKAMGVTYTDAYFGTKVTNIYMNTRAYRG